jgi:spermidine synthase
MYNPRLINFNGPWEQVLAAPFWNNAPYDPARVKQMAIVGLAAGTTAREASAVFPGVVIDGIEIDPKIVEVARRYFDMNDPNLNVIIQDGRWGLEKSPHRYQVISVDAYRPPYIPWHLTTREFFKEAYDHLNENGVLVINVGRSPNDRSLIDGLVGTIASVFPSVYVMDVPESFNSMVYATVQPTTAANLYENYAAIETDAAVHPLLLKALQTTIVYLQPTPQSQIVYTDDRAPVEWITNYMVLNYVLFGDLEVLQ